MLRVGLCLLRPACKISCLAGCPVVGSLEPSAAASESLLKWYIFFFFQEGLIFWEGWKNSIILFGFLRNFTWSIPSTMVHRKFIHP